MVYRSVCCFLTSMAAVLAAAWFISSVYGEVVVAWLSLAVAIQKQTFAPINCICTLEEASAAGADDVDSITSAYHRHAKCTSVPGMLIGEILCYLY